MKKNKTLAYALAATLLVGGTFVGTKALFTDKIDTVGELKISTGDVDIDIIKDTNWELTRLGEDTNTGTGNPNGTTFDFDNLKTNDEIKRTVTVKNDGTLRAQLKFDKTENFNLPHENTLLKYTIELKEKDTNNNTSDNIIEPGEEAVATMTIKVIGGGQHNIEDALDDKWNSDEQELLEINLTGAWTLDATQVQKESSVEKPIKPIQPIQ